MESDQYHIVYFSVSKFDPSLFVVEKVTCIVYIDNIIFLDRHEDNIHNLEMHLRELSVDLEQEDDSSVFLGVNLEQERNIRFIEMKQTGLIQSVFEALILDNGMVTGKFIPSEQRPLVKYTDGKPTSGVFSYSSVFVMLLYLSGYACPYIYFAINCCARYMFRTKISHELVLKRLAQYLIHTQDRGQFWIQILISSKLKSNLMMTSH